jgi:hypothetical protein
MNGHAASPVSRPRLRLALAASALALLSVSFIVLARSLPRNPAAPPAEASFLDEMGTIVAPLAAEAEAVRHSDLSEDEKTRRWEEIRSRRRAAVGDLYRRHGKTPPPGH